MKLIIDRNIVFGNRKLPRSTGIYNMCAAHDCPSLARGMCQVVNSGHKCYAMRDEAFYPGPLGYRRRQEKAWDACSAGEFAGAFLDLAARRRRVTASLRLNEAGDFRSQADVDKAAEVARILRLADIVVYTYTARHDLDYSRAAPLVINGSGFMVHGEFRFIHARVEKPAGYGICPGDCRKCSRCLRGMRTCVLPH